jgi:hypothetical protein
MQVLPARFTSDDPYIVESCEYISCVVSWSASLVLATRIFELETTKPLDAGFAREAGYPNDPPQDLAFLLSVTRTILDELLFKNTQFSGHIHMAPTVPYL